jgi:hypothetical protein
VSSASNSTDWVPLHIESDDDVESDLAILPPDTRADVLHAIEKYATEGIGSAVTLSPPGGRPMDALNIDGIEVRFLIDPQGENGPTMVLSEICAAADPPDADLDD